MITIAIGEIDAQWPKAEEALAAKEDVILTRGGEAVAKLTCVKSVKTPKAKKARKRLTVEEHLKWQESVFGKGVVFTDIDEMLQKDREDRVFD